MKKSQMFVNNGFCFKRSYKAECLCVVFRSFRCDQRLYIFHLFAKDK